MLDLAHNKALRERSDLQALFRTISEQIVDGQQKSQFLKS